MHIVARKACAHAATLALALLTVLVWPEAADPAAASDGVPQQYRVVSLGALSPNGTGEALAINDRGDAVGYSRSPSGYMHPFLWRDGVMTDLGALEPGQNEYGVATDVNNHGDVVGSGDVAGGTAMHGFVWRDGELADLGTLGGPFSAASAINDRGQIVGTSSTSSGEWHAFLWENGQMTDLGIPLVADINNRGQIVGTTDFPAGYHGYRLWRDRLTDLGVLPGGSQSEAHAINNQGWIAGDGNSAAHPSARGAYLWRNGTMRELPGLDGTYSTATTVNDRGMVLGDSMSPSGPHPVLWYAGTVIDLTTRGIRYSGMTVEAGPLRDINNAAQIAGSYYFTYGRLDAAVFVRDR